MEVQLAITALAFILAVQGQFIISRTRFHTDRRSTAAPKDSIRKKPTRQTQPVLSQKEQPIDPTVFSRFQKNLSQTTTTEPEKPQTEEEVVVSLSSKAKGRQAKAPGTPAAEQLPDKGIPPRSTGPTRQTAKTLKTPEASDTRPEDIKVGSIDSIFDDISAPPDIEPRKVDPVKLPPKRLDKLISKTATPPDSTASPPKKADHSPLTANELLTENDFKPDAEAAQDDAEMMLSLAKSYYDKKQYPKCITTLEQLLGNVDNSDMATDVLLDAMQLKGECEIELERFETAAKTFQDLFKNRISNEHPQYLERLEQTIARFVDAGQQQFAVHFLFTALNEFRQQHEFNKMDEIYTEIESAYHQKQDLPRLIQTYQNHLAIKKTIKDFKGQLDILDHLGKLLYDQGDDEGSRKCYEQRLAIENRMEKS